MKKGLIHGSLTLLVLAIVAVLAAPSIIENTRNVVLRDDEWPVPSCAPFDQAVEVLRPQAITISFPAVCRTVTSCCR